MSSGRPMKPFIPASHSYLDWNNMHIIGITGSAQHGKNTIAEYIKRWINPHQTEAQIIAIADSLREWCEIVNPIVTTIQPGEFLRYNQLIESVGYERAKLESEEFRRFLQDAGVGARKIIGPNVWLDAFKNKIEQLPSYYVVIVPDIRFPNEADFIRKNGTLIAVTRFNEDWSSFNSGVNSTHSSESHVEYLKGIADEHFQVNSLDMLATQLANSRVMKTLADARLLC
jgi:hypothetical protein